MKLAIAVSCEHGGNRVPARYRKAFARAARDLDSHLGWDPGALTLARALARDLEAPLCAWTTTRLLVDPNRSSHHPQVFSEWTRDLPPEEREEILARWWAPHRGAVEELVRAHSRRRTTVLHLSIHSFTPRWKGRRRAVDVGWLYDPARPRERAFAGQWLGALRTIRGDLCLRRNQPYRGNADGLTTHLRTRFEEHRYLGLELEVSQRFTQGPASAWRRLRHDLGDALRAALSSTQAGH